MRADKIPKIKFSHICLYFLTEYLITIYYLRYIYWATLYHNIYQ
jgi:hypothetical protein